MILIINGSFGVGKTTVARLLRRKLVGSVLYDPEWAGSILKRLPSSLNLRGAGTDDFQDIELWRKSVLYGTKIFQSFTRGPVIVPMAFFRRDYFDEIVQGIHKSNGQLKIYCLKATIATILERLEKRGEKIENGENNWIVRKAQMCVKAHQDAHFGEPVNTEGVSASVVVEDILRRLRNNYVG